MMSSLRHAIDDLLWSLWAELGVASTVRNHTAIVVDPEPLLLHTPHLGDSRLIGEVVGWCRAHHPWISKSRLTGLLGQASEEVAAAWSPVAATLADTVSWPGGDAAPWPDPPSDRSYPLNPSRPSLLRLRLRGLVGVGSRADVLATLLAQPDRAWRTSDLTPIGYSKRAIADALHGLRDAGVVRTHGSQSATLWRLAAPAAWDPIVHTAGLTAFDAATWFSFCACAIRLDALSDRPPALRRVYAANTADDFSRFADQLWLPPPPAIRGHPESWTLLMNWTSDQLHGIAQGALPPTTHAVSAR